jgi:hypothetical protein
MASTPLATYLNDHLGGAIGGIELLENIEHAFAGTDVEPQARQLRLEVIEDKEQLRTLMARLDIGESTTRKAVGWLAEKAAQIKLRISDPATGPLRLLESVEAMSIGVEAKRLLWQALASVAEHHPALGILNYDALIARAEDQRRRLERIRLDAVREATAPKE